jgi:hypothetical protein
MKLVYFSADRLEVETLSRALSEAGIPCEVRAGLEGEGLPPYLPEAELWIQNDGDVNRAFMVCVARESGFAKRDTPAFSIEDLLPEVMAA